MMIKRTQDSSPYLNILFLVSVFLLALIKIEDVDTWLHLSLGREIWHLKGLPGTEPFEYPLSGQPFSYTSWLFGLIYFAAYSAFDIYGVILLKAALVCSCFYILLRDSVRPGKNPAIAILVLSFVVVIARYRFTERPEIFMLIFVAFSIFSLNAYIYEEKKYLYALPFVHLLWANIHSSVPLMFIPFLAFIGGGLLLRSLPKSERFINVPTTSQLKTISLVFIASFVASLASPYFIDQYLYGTQVLSTAWYKQETMELLPPTWSTQKWPFIITPIVIISFFMNTRRFSLMQALLVIPFIALSFTADRFTSLFSIVAGPIVARNISAFLEGKKWWTKFSGASIVLAIATASWIVLYTALVFGRVEPFVDAHLVDSKNFGFGINYDRYPEGALRYMDKQNITGRVFNTFPWGQYIIWRDYPARTVFIDGRANLPEPLLENMMLARSRPEVLDELSKSYGFESILVDYPVQEETAQPLSSQQWALVYWDDLSLLYLKRGGKYDPVIKKDEYHLVRPANTVLSTRTAGGSAAGRTQLINELKRNVEETGSSKAHAYLGQIYNDAGSYEQAIEEFSQVRYFPTVQNHLRDRYSGMAYAYSRLDKPDMAQTLYLQALKLQEDPALYYQVGKLYLKKGDISNAIVYLEKSLKKDANFIYSYPALITLYRSEDRESDAKNAEKNYAIAVQIKKGETHLASGLKAAADGHPDLALKEFNASLEVNPQNPAAYYYMGIVYFNGGLINEAFECQKKALEIDRNYAMANYALAMIYRARGDSFMEKKYFEKYLKVEPNGYFSRRAKEYSASIGTASEQRIQEKWVTSLPKLPEIN